MPREFDCNGLMSTVPGDDGGCTCFGCKANRAIADAVKEERERCVMVIDNYAASIKQKPGAGLEWATARRVADLIRQELA